MTFRDVGDPRYGTVSLSKYDQLSQRLHRLNTQRTALATIYDDLNFFLISGATFDDEVRERFRQRIAAGGSSYAAALAGDDETAPVSASEIATQLDRSINRIDDDLERLYLEAWTIDKAATYTEFGHVPQVDELFNEFLDREALRAGPTFQPAPYQFQVLPSGEVMVFNPNNGSITSAGVFPGAAQREVLQDKDGNLISINPSNPSDVEVLVEGFGFPEIDPRIEFETNVRLQQQGIMLQFAGLDLERRGMMVQALGDDMANQIALGRMTYDEAQLRLNTISEALTQRRAEREQALQFAVRRSSIRTDESGQEVTRLPGAEQLAGILSETTGQLFGPEFFELPTGKIDPEQAAAAVIAAGQFASPIPGLRQNLETNRAVISEIVNAPVAAQMVAAAATSEIVGGV